MAATPGRLTARNDGVISVRSATPDRLHATSAVSYPRPDHSENRRPSGG
jgi:hypothetical protein